MKRLLNRLALLLTLVTAIPAYAGDLYFLREATSVYESVMIALQGCGLSRVRAHDSRLPRPQVPADEAIVDAQGRILAYTDYQVGGGVNELVFKNPNGGYGHRIHFSSEGISYSTPYLGKVAWINRALSVNGPFYTWWCRSTQVTAGQYQECVSTYFVTVIADQLCH